jgi:hypothetical protein
MFARKSAIYITEHEESFCVFILPSYPGDRTGSFLLANCTVTCVKNGFVYNCPPTEGRYYFCFGLHLDSDKC